VAGYYWAGAPAVLHCRYYFYYYYYYYYTTTATTTAATTTTVAAVVAGSLGITGTILPANYYCIKTAPRLY